MNSITDFRQNVFNVQFKANERKFNINGNELIYSFDTNTLQNETNGTIIHDFGLCKVTDRSYNGNGIEQYYSCNKKNPDCDYVEFSFKKGNKPIIAVENGSVLYPDGELVIRNCKVVGKELRAYEDIGGWVDPIEEPISIKEAKKIINDFRSHIDELSPRIRRIIKKIKKVSVG